MNGAPGCSAGHDSILSLHLTTLHLHNRSCQLHALFFSHVQPLNPSASLSPSLLIILPSSHFVSAFSLLQAAGESYGKQRQWGSIGFGLSSLPAGWLIGQTGLTSCFLVYGLVSLPLIAITSLMRYNYTSASAAVTTAATAGNDNTLDVQSAPDSTQQQQSLRPQQQQSAAPAGSTGQQEQQQQQGQEESARSLLRQPAVLLFLWRCLLLGLGMGVMSNYEFLWLKQLGAPEMLLGVAIAVSCLERPGGGSSWGGCCSCSRHAIRCHYCC